MSKNISDNSQRKQYFFVVRELVSREIKRKYSRSKLGILWSVLNPLLSMAVLSMIFSTMFSRSIENYPIYYLTGYTIWNLFTNATNTAMTSLVDNKTLLLQVKLPKVIFPVARVYTAFVNFLYSLIAYAIMLIVFKVKPDIHMLWFPVIVAFLLLFCMGVSYILTIAFSFFGDIKHLYSVILTLWMYLSAIFYPVDALPDFAYKVIVLNPIYIFIASARNCMMYGVTPSLGQWLRMVLSAGIAYLIGWFCFKKMQDKIIQKI
ncbi:Polysialic acid transport protein kpsM [uncultured Roseburia sp.]|uniref:Transport permease protein n=1 Tax=Brotonthovivens ammoniilytica TaxID=2981725 RepID=A0ABT2TF86_9FIRM|nr:ABC transporter permease [Brotonthovivens ammoniilytica]MCU6760812.1 ABC transporter permease [Brotonthovivens ammoniilytica]SCI10066.1 Polysialic acid transport protein kpsM [uncultured Roseburia sp.]